MTFATLRALHAAIGTALDDIESIYRPLPQPTAAPAPILHPLPQPKRSPRTPQRQSHLPSPPSYSPSPPPLPSPSRSPSPHPSPSDCSHTIDVASLPTPISVNFTAPPNQKARGRERAQTLPTSTRPGVPKRVDIETLDGRRVHVLTESGEALDWPDLDVPVARPKPLLDQGDAVRSAEPRKLTKAEKEEELMTRPEVINAINRIVAACSQLSASVQRPFLTLCDAAMGYHLPSCLRFLEAAHIVEILREAGTTGMHAKDIASKVSQRYPPGVTHKPVDPARLSHILRLLATHHITREVRPDVFANNRLSSFIDSGKNVEDLMIGSESKYEGMDGTAAFIGLCADELFKASAYLTDCYLIPQQASPSRPPGQHPQATVRAHTPRASDTSLLESIKSTHSRKWEDPRNESPLTPKTPKTSPGQVNSPSVTSDASLTPPTFAPNTHARIPSVPLVHEILGNPEAQPEDFLSSPISLRRQMPKVASPRHKGSLASLSSYQGSQPASPNVHGLQHNASSYSLVNLGTPSHNLASHNLLPPVSIPTHKPSLQSLASPKHKSSLSSLLSSAHKSSHSSLSGSSNINLSSSPMSSVQLSPVQEKLTPSRKKSQSFLRKLGSSSILSPVFNHSKGDENVGQNDFSNPEGGYMRYNAHSPTSAPLSSHPSMSSLHSPGLVCSPWKHHSHTTSSTSSFTRTTTSSAQASLQIDLQSQQDVIAGEPPPTPPKSMLITANHPMYAPFNVAFGTTQPYFEWLERPENQMRLKRFGKAMTGTSGWEVPGAIFDSLAWDELPLHSVVVDIGGGIGSTSMLLANTFKHLRFVIQDREPVVEMGIAAWKVRCPELLSSGQAVFLAHDFLTPQPSLPDSLDLGQIHKEASPRSPPAGGPSKHALPSQILGAGRTEPLLDGKSAGVAASKPAAVYLLRVITHDWPDEFVTRILLHLRNAAGPDTKLLIADHLLPLACIDEGSREEDSTEGRVPSEKDRKESLPGLVRTLAPEGTPLLPNLGKANANAYWMDLTMRVVFNSQERTLRELTALTLTAGWKVVHVSRSEGSLFGYVVAVPVDIPPRSLALLSKFDESKQNPEGLVGRGRSGTITNNPEPMFSPPMGDTFFSETQLPSDDAIRRHTLFSRLTRRTNSSPGQRQRKMSLIQRLSPTGLGWGLGFGSSSKTMTSANDRLGAVKEPGRDIAAAELPSGSSDMKGKKRARANTVCADVTPRIGAVGGTTTPTSNFGVNFAEFSPPLAFPPRSSPSSARNGDESRITTTPRTPLTSLPSARGRLSPNEVTSPWLTQTRNPSMQSTGGNVSEGSSGTGKKAWKSLKKMLSKPHLSGHAGTSASASGTSLSPLPPPPPLPLPTLPPFIPKIGGSPGSSGSSGSRR